MREYGVAILLISPGSDEILSLLAYSAVMSQPQWMPKKSRAKNQARGWLGFTKRSRAWKDAIPLTPLPRFAGEGFLVRNKEQYSFVCISVKLFQRRGEKMPTFSRSALIFIIVVLILSACNLPSSAPATEEPNTVFTAAALTVQAQLTQPASFSTPTLPPTLLAPLSTNTVSALPTLAAPTFPPAASATAACDLAQFVRDVTIPDGSTYAPGAPFTKTWRLKNAGNCTWSGYSLAFESGDQMNGTSPTTIGAVTPGQEVDISVTLTAPATAGSYRGYWGIRNASGVFIPVLGGTQGKSFFVDIKVVVTSSGLDLHTRAVEASWAGSGGAIVFGGPDTNTNGFAMYKNGQRLEDGSAPTKILEIHPQWVDDGKMNGLYPGYLVVTGEHFKSQVGFLALGDGSCGTGNAKFQLNYKETGILKPLGEWAETCDGSLRNIDVDLSSLAAKTVQFELAVLANGSAGQDWAVWVSPRVQLP